ncbi:helix-turn-helix transcriptional regulator [Gemella sp. 27098_8_92]|uniref:helix-turn-helix domain-containing protein n=1 Tax=Gemella sp. 27098_8_92 TaxID=3003687 RepID=UPI00352D4B38
MVNIEKLKKEIDKNNSSIEEISQQIGIDKSTFYRRLESNGKKFTIEEVIKISNILNLDRKKVDEIFFNITVA